MCVTTCLSSLSLTIGLALLLPAAAPPPCFCFIHCIFSNFCFNWVYVANSPELVTATLENAKKQNCHLPGFGSHFVEHFFCILHKYTAQK